jgi:DNA polymerase III epsilon subunit-like protein
MSLFKSQIVVWDTETTGLPRDSWASVVDLGAVLVDTSGEIIDQFECLILPEVLDERATPALAISGLTPEALRSDGLAVGEAKSRAEAWVTEHHPDPFDRALIPFHTSFNIDFDIGMMTRMGLEVGRWCGCIMRKAQTEMGAAGALPRFSNGQYKFPKLSEASAFYGVPMESPAHRALADAKTAAKIMVAIQKRRIGL